MKKIHKILLILFVLTNSYDFLIAQTYSLHLKQQYNATRTQVFVDVYITTTSGSWNMGSANLVVNFDESNLSFVGRDVSYDGPFDNGANPLIYLDMGSTEITILGDKCVNITINPITSACPPTNGVTVPTTPTRIARLIFNINGDCGSDPGIAWKTGIGTGTINKWNSGSPCTITNIKGNASFVNPPPIGSL
ncbi:MAG: hypothetical protein KatS3mg035_0815 [Bacteroidia bacterium]|nr:MAG: hypothetical protein KatS3mg035_0815 [Bacteroidia bacterium]